MLEEIDDLVTVRVIEIREFIDFFSPQIPSPPTPTPRYLNSCKGMVFVQLYGLIEYTILQTIQKTIYFINEENVKITMLKPRLLSLALNPTLDSLIQANKAKWDKRIELFSQIEKDMTVQIENHLIPTNGDNIHIPQLNSIKETFCISSPIIHDISFQSRLKEIAANRINIAHGNFSAWEVGQSYTPTALLSRLDEVSKFASYFIKTFDDYLLNKEFIN